jgi:DNA-binding transcriptional ArsR family regulator
MRDRETHGDTRPSVYNRALWEAPKPYPFGPEGWAFAESDPKLASPLKRFGALANILNNGGKTVTLLAMNPYGKFENYEDIRANSNELADENIIKVKKGTLQFLTLSLEKVGATAQSTLDEEDWKLTAFGKAIKPAAVYAWEASLLLDFAPSEIFGKNTHILEDEDAEESTNTATNRIKLFINLKEGPTTLGNIAQLLGQSYNSVGETIRGLRGKGLVEMESIDSPFVGTVTAYSLTKAGNTEESWEPYAKPRTSRPSQGVYRHASKSIEDAIKQLKSQGITTVGAKEISNQLEKIGVTVGDHARFGAIFKHFAGLGYLERQTPFEFGHYSTVKLTQKGEEVYDVLIKPLYDWFENPQKPAINQAVQGYAGFGFEAYKHLITQIIEKYKEKSSGLNADFGKKINDVLGCVGANDGQLNYKLISEMMDWSSTLTGEICRLLIKKGFLIRKPANNNSRPTLWISPSYLAQIEPQLTSQKAG